MALTQTQAAQIEGITSRRLRQLHQEDKGPPQNADGQYDEGHFGQWQRRRAAGLSGGLNTEAERARLLAAQASLAELKLAVEKGELVSASEVDFHWRDICIHIRQSLMRLPYRISVICAHTPETRVKMQGLAEQLVREALEEVARGPLPQEDSTQ